MSQSFTAAEWSTIETFLDDPDNSEIYGIPEKRTDSLLFASWNIRKFGALLNKDGSRKKSEGASRMIARFCGQCDLIAIQEQQTDYSALEHLVETLNAAGGNYDFILSDVAGRQPGRRGMAERHVFLYNRDKIRIGQLASDLNFDRTAIASNIKEAHRHALEGQIPDDSDPNMLERATQFLTRLREERALNKKLKQFVQFIRSPHIVEFIVSSADNSPDYQIYAINTHLIDGTRTEREREFFTLLEWMMLSSRDVVSNRGKTYMLLGDLNLDYEKNADARMRGIEDYITSLNRKKRMDAKVNFPFLDKAFMTNARENKTFDHIAFIADDTRWPRARYNDLAGTIGPDDYDFGMFNFTQAFIAAGPGAGADNFPDYAKFEHDLSDHMPIWLRMPIPRVDQRRYIVD